MSERPLPHIVYHYVTQEGLLGILKERALFATKIRYFDDNSEFIGPLRIALDILAQKGLDSHLDDRQREIVSSAQWAIEESRNINISVVSFTAQPDSEHFWQGYADHGCGCAIGFDSGRLCQVAHPHVLCQCEYLDADEQREKMHRLIASELDGSTPPEQAPLWLRLMRMAMTIKGKHFAVEEEWRLVPGSCYWQDLVNCNCTYLTCQLRPGKRSLKPYWLLPIELSAIMKIVVGPKLDPELAVDGVKALIQRFQLSEDIQITISKSRLP
jgi:hypothetical protein